MTAGDALEPVKVALDQTGRKYRHDKLNHIQASCPGPNHRRGDRNYSLSIDYDPTKRKVLMWCHVCGPVGDMDAVRDALGLSIADLSEESRGNSSRSRTRSQLKSPPSSQNSELKCGGTFEEHGWPSIGEPDKPARGETWFPREWDRGFPIAWKVRRTCVRCGDRTFLWLRIDDQGNLTWGKPDGVMPLGGLRDLLDAIHGGEHVHAYITEGDSDAQAVRKAGAIAVTAGGVNDWVPEHFDQLDGVARVTICSDADTPGRNHARRLRAELDKRGILCRVVEPLDGKDVREHLEVGLSLGDLVPWPPTDHPFPDQPEARPEDGPQRQLVLTRASDIEPRCVHWLWQGRLALGTLALLAGREGIGKSILIYTVAAMITQGMLPGKFYGAPKSVLVAATEESWAQTIVPRLIAAGADLTRVIRVEVLTSDLVHVELSLPADLLAVRRAAQKLDAALLILDPLTSRLSDKLDTHKDAEVRQALEPTVRMADDAGIAVWGIIHHNKTATADPLQAVMASKAFTAVARSVHTVMVDPDDETERRRLFGTPKNNLGRVDLPTLNFVIDSYQVPTDEGPTEVGQLRWGEDSKVSIFEAMRRASEDADKRSAAADAGEWAGGVPEVQGRPGGVPAG